jgi:IS1 family transposase
MIRRMNKLAHAKRVQVLTLLCEGMSMRAASRVAGVSYNTVCSLLTDAGEACVAFHDEAVRGVKAKRVQCDEIWSFVYAKQRNVAAAKAAPEVAGDLWTWLALDADSKLIVAYLVGDRGAACANALMDDAKRRLSGRVQLTTDGHRAYLEAVESAFGADVDYAQLVKLYGEVPEAEGTFHGF